MLAHRKVVSFKTSGIKDSGAQKIPTRSKEDGSEGQRPRLWDKGKEWVPGEGEEGRLGFLPSSEVLRGAYRMPGTAPDTRVREAWICSAGSLGEQGGNLIY